METMKTNEAGSLKRVEPAVTAGEAGGRVVAPGVPCRSAPFERLQPVRTLP